MSLEGVIRNCESCLEEYNPIRLNQKYCSDCRDKGEWYASRFNLRKRLNSLAYSALNRAKTKNLPYNIDTDYIERLWNDQEGMCVVSGRVFNLDSYGTYGQANPDAPSIDRINPKLGYVKGNVRLVTYLTNVCLSEYGHESLLKLCEDILMQAGIQVINEEES